MYKPTIMFAVKTYLSFFSLTLNQKQDKINEKADKFLFPNTSRYRLFCTSSYIVDAQYVCNFNFDLFAIGLLPNSKLIPVENSFSILFIDVATKLFKTLMRIFRKHWHSIKNIYNNANIVEIMVLY